MRVLRKKKDITTLSSSCSSSVFAFHEPSSCTFKRINIIIINLRRGNFVSSVSPIQTIQRAKTRHKNKNKSKNDFDTSSQNTNGKRNRERERE